MLLSLVLFTTGLFISNNKKGAQAATYLSSTGWEFFQGGCYEAQSTELGNVGYISSVKMATNSEEINAWERDKYNTQTQTASADTGAAVTIENNGWDAQWKGVTGFPTVRINPWSIQAMAKFNGMNYDHKYKVTFKAKATKKKYCFVNFNTVVDGHEMSPYDNVEGALTGDAQVIVLGTQEKEFTYTFPDYVGGHELTVIFMLGAFTQDNDGHVYDYAGNDLPQCDGGESLWKNGTVTFSDVKVEDLDTDKPTDPPIPTLYTTAPNTTIRPTVQPRTTKKPSILQQFITVANIKNAYYKSRFSLKAKTSGNGKLTYKSSDTSIAKVSSSGIVTTYGCGTVKITINASKTSSYNATKKEMIFTVKPKKGSGLRLKSTKKNLLKISWKRSRDADGYLVQLCKTKKFNKSVLQKTFSKNKKITTVRFANQSHKKFFVRMKLFKKTNGIIYYGKWSKVKKIRIK